MENSRPAPSGETRGTCDHAAHCCIHQREGACFNWKPLAPEATTKEPEHKLWCKFPGRAAPTCDCQQGVQTLTKDFPRVAPGEAVGRETRERFQTEFEEWGKDRFIMSRYTQTDFKLDYQNGNTHVAWQGWKGRAEFESRELSTLRRERDQLKETLDLAVEDTNELDKEVAKLESQVRELTAQKNATIDSLQRSLTDYQKQAQRDGAWIREAVKVHPDMAATIQENRELRAAVEKQQNKLAELGVAASPEAKHGE